MKLMSDLVYEMRDSIKESKYYENELEKIRHQIIKFIELKKDEIILAWWAEHGFSPEEAELVHYYEDNKFCCYIRKRKIND